MSGHISPQVVADTYNRPVVVFTYREFYVEKDRKMKEFKDAFSFFPLVEMNIIENINNPILLLLAQSHFYLIELKKTPKGKLKKYEKIPLNTDHQRIRKTYPQQCNSVDFSMMCLLSSSLYETITGVVVQLYIIFTYSYNLFIVFLEVYQELTKNSLNSFQKLT
ncbi:hypothetical protein BD770DRAFT_413610 [Pilaira anomala]|nr:hypothetical protein BD770DRAFT_413610 [Pilaira anomala]